MIIIYLLRVTLPVGFRYLVLVHVLFLTSARLLTLWTNCLKNWAATASIHAEREMSCADKRSRSGHGVKVHIR